MSLLIADRDSTERTGIEWLVTSYSMKFAEIRQTADMVSLMKEIEEFKPNVLLVELEMIPPSGWDVFVRAIERFAGAVSQKENAHGDFIERGLRYIDEHYHRSDLSLEEVANYVQRSPSYFSHILSGKRTQTFRQYVTDIRMKQAKHLLSTTSLTVREIGYAVGYDDPNYFSRLFKEYTGCSPRAWRNR